MDTFDPVAMALNIAARPRKAEGGPLDVYHGSAQTGLDELRPSDRGPLGPALYFSPAAHVAQRYAGQSGRLYQHNLNRDDLFHGTKSTHPPGANPYDIWRSQEKRLVEAAPADKKQATAALFKKLDPGDGYRLFWDLSVLHGSKERAQKHLKDAGYKGMSADVDGPEVAWFDKAVPSRGHRADGGAIAAPSPMDWSQPKVSPLGLYSHAATVAGKMPMAKGSPDQVKGYLLKQGVKPDEIEHSKFDDKFGGQKSVTREQVAQHFHNNQPQLSEKILNAPSGFDYDGLPAKQVGSPKFESYTLPGGKNYREVLLTAPEQQRNDVTYAIRGADGRNAPAQARTRQEAIREAGGDPRRVVEIANKNDAVNYKSSHWDDPNVVLHRRLSDRPLPDGGKALHLEELQSDWGQEGRDKGFGSGDLNKWKELDAQLSQLRDANSAHAQDLHRKIIGKSYQEFIRTNPPKDERESVLAQLKAARDRDPDYVAREQKIKEIEEARNAVSPVSKVPHHPLVDKTGKWLDLGLKRTLYDAAKGGYGKVLITPGDEQASRYDLSKHIDAITYRNNNGVLEGRAEKDGKTLHQFEEKPEALSRVFGKDIADKMAKGEGAKASWHDYEGAPQDHKKLSGLDLKVGGEGMKSFYDKMLPQALEKLAKRHDPDAKVQLGGQDMRMPDPQQRHIEQDHPPHVTRKLHSLDITPKMRASILKGMPTFATGGTVDDDDANEIENIKAIHPARRTADQVRRLHGLKLPGDEGPSSPPMLLRAMGGRIRQADEDQIGDHTPAQAKASANGTTPRSDIIDKGLAILHTQADEITKDAERTGKATGGSVSDDRLDKLMALVVEQADAINRLTTILSTPQTVVRDKEGRIKEVRRIPNKKALN
jgi:hypothetical protein